MKTRSVVVAALLVLGSGVSGASEQGCEPNSRAEKKFVLDWLSQPAVIEKFGHISEAIWRFAELGLQEFKSSALLVETLKKEGFHVDKGLAGMPTCFVASYGTGKPVIGILAEFDALPMLSQKARVTSKEPLVEGAPGHGCGHNLMGSAATAAAIAVKRCMEKHNLRGTIKLFGSPAEETLISRPYMVRAGLFQDVDAVINNHASSEFSTDYGVKGTAVYSVVFMFTGKTAHSGSSPWSGRSALDAVEIMNISTNYLREHLHFASRMHYVVLDGGEAPNVVPDRASVWYYLRNSDDRLEEMYQRVVNCAKGAALATGTELAPIRCLSAIHQSHHNQALAELFQENIKLVGMPPWTDEEQAFARALQKSLGKEEKGMPADVNKLKGPDAVFTGGASSDHGDVTLIAPTATIRFPGEVPGAIGHHWSCVACNSGSGAWKGLNAGAKAMAASAVDLLTKPEVLRKAQEEFAAYSKKHPYKSFLPPDVQPPLDMNKTLMEKYRPLLEKMNVGANMAGEDQRDIRRQVSRRKVLRAMAGSGAAMITGTAATSGGERVAGAGRIKQSIAYWCVQKYWRIEKTCQVARELGCKSVELVDPKDWPTLKKYGLVCAIANSHWFDKGMNNPQYHAMCLSKLREAIEACGDAGFPNVITFTGLAEGIGPEEGIRNCVAGYKKIMSYAEKQKVNLCLEVLNSRVAVDMVGVPGYQGDHTDYCMQIVRQVGSPRMKLLFDIFHVQIMDGDIIARIRQYKDYIGHYHTAGNPGRRELDDQQEINYRPIMEEIARTGYSGYVGHEFIPTRDPREGLRHAVTLCDVW